MSGHPYYQGALRLHTQVLTGERIDWNTGTFNLALVGSDQATGLVKYAQNQTTDVHWSDIVDGTNNFEIVGSGYTAGGVQLTPETPYLDTTTVPGFGFIVFTANAGATPAYTQSWNLVTISGVLGGVVYQVGTTHANSPLLTYIDLSNMGVSPINVVADKFVVQFEPLGIHREQVR
jgi:hypothetical protein